MPDRPDLLPLARQVAGAAKPGEQVEAYVARSRSTEVKVFGGEVESVSSATIDGVGVRVVVDGRQGYAWAGSLDPDIVAETLEEARDNAGFGSPDEHHGLASPADAVRPPDMAETQLDLWREGLAAVPADAKVALALDLERAVLAGDARIRGVRVASYGDGAVETAVANSLGVQSATRRTVCSCAALALAGEGTATRTGYGWSVGREPADLDVAEAATMAVERTVRLLGATQPRSRRLPVVFDPLVSASLIGIVAAACNGEAVLKGRSMFVGRQGEEVAAAGVTLLDDPTNPLAYGASAYDSEGIPTRAVPLIAAGRLGGFLHNVYTGRRSGVGTTGSAVRGAYKSTPGVGARALRLEPGASSPEELMARAEGGLYVQSVSGMGTGASPVSGDFSVGAEGLMITDGDLGQPVRELTVASTLQRILGDLVVGSDLTWLPGGAAGVTLLVPEMTMSGA
ncbi:MAG: TldD/PmbA family protein [Actinomycetota bacterium]|nr:TldD/PmbA family protein [Actinomycetota bacterium]